MSSSDATEVGVRGVRKLQVEKYESLQVLESSEPTRPVQRVLHLCCRLQAHSITHITLLMSSHWLNCIVGNVVTGF